MLVPLRDRGHVAAPALPQSTLRPVRKGQTGRGDVLITSMVRDRVNAQKAGMSDHTNYHSPLGRARQYFVAREKQTVNHEEYTQQKNSISAELVNKVMQQVLSHPEHYTPVSPETVAASFADTALKHIHKELEDFPDRGAFFAHVHSKLEWLLRELGDTADRCTLLNYKYERLKEDHRGLRTEKEDLLARFESMKEIMKERTAAFHEARTTLEDRIAQLQSENNAYRVKNQQLLGVTKRAKLNAVSQQTRVLASLDKVNALSNAVTSDDEDDAKMKSRRGSQDSDGQDAERLALSRRMRAALDRAEGHSTGGSHNDVVKNVSAEMDMERGELGRLMADAKRMEKTYALDKQNFDEKVAALERDRRKLLLQLDEEHATSRKDAEGFMMEIAKQSLETQNARNELENANVEIQTLRAATVELKAKCDELKELISMEKQSHTDSVSTLHQQHFDFVADTKRRHEVRMAREAMAKMLIEREEMTRKLITTQALLDDVNQRFSDLQRHSLNTPSAHHLLQRLQDSFASLVGESGPHFVAQLRSRTFGPPHALNLSPRSVVVHSIMQDLLLGPLSTMSLDEATARNIGLPMSLLQEVNDVRSQIITILEIPTTQVDVAAATPVGGGGKAKKVGGKKASSNTTSTPPAARKLQPAANTPITQGTPSNDQNANAGSAPVVQTSNRSVQTMPSMGVDDKNANQRLNLQELFSRDVDKGGSKMSEIQVVQFRLRHALDENNSLRQHLVGILARASLFPFAPTRVEFQEEYTSKVSECEDLNHAVDWLRGEVRDTRRVARHVRREQRQHLIRIAKDVRMWRRRAVRRAENCKKLSKMLREAEATIDPEKVANQNDEEGSSTEEDENGVLDILKNFHDDGLNLDWSDSENSEDDGHVTIPQRVKS